MEDEPWAGRPLTSRSEDNVNHVKDSLNTDKRLSVHMIPDTLGIDKVIVHKINW